MIPACTGLISQRIAFRNTNNSLSLLQHRFVSMLAHPPRPSNYTGLSSISPTLQNRPLQYNSFSTAPQVADPPVIHTSNTTPKQNKSSSNSGRTKRDAITITPRAAQRILTLLAQPSAAEAIGIRLGVRRRGCNGLSYTLNYAMESDRSTKGVEEVSAHGVTVIIDPTALFSVVGTTMDWLETDLSSEFVFENPNSKGKCGCGESFNV